ncbi:MAG TPA: hypothetical protein VGF45_20095 [Polyangia bacterium]
MGLFSLVTSVEASAAETSDVHAARETVTICTSLITPFFGAYYLEGKFRASDSFAAIVNTSFLTLENDDWKNRAGTVGAGLEYFFQGDAFRRWYVEAIGEVWLSSWRHEPSGEVAPVGLGYAGIALVGYQFVFKGGAVIDLGAGVVGFHLPSVSVDDRRDGLGMISSKALTKIYPAAKVNVGWAF